MESQSPPNRTGSGLAEPNPDEAISESEAENLHLSCLGVKSKFGKTTKWLPLLGIKNDSATIAEPCKPWEYVPHVPAFEKKGDYTKWRAATSTDHLLFAGAEGVNADLRPNKKTNPVARLNAIIADYDSNISEAIEAAIIKNAPADLRPNWISRTYSGGRRLVWIFDKPILFDDMLAKRFYEIAEAQLHASSLLPGLDKTAFANPYQFYDVGTDWRQLSDKPLSSNIAHQWLFEASQRTDWSKAGELRIPFADAAEEVLRQFGETIEVGQRIHRFWTPGDIGGNPSACVVTEHGMICFSRDPLFWPWPKVLGAEFARKYQADKISRLTQDVWYDGKQYHRKLKGRWKPWPKEDFRKWAVTQKVDSSKGSGSVDTASELDEIEVYIHENRRVDGVAPSIFNASDTFEVKGLTFLNNSVIRPIQPHEEPQEWAANFHWLAKFFEIRYTPHECDIQLAWWRRFYLNALSGDLESGQALFIAGPPGTGKTLLSHKIIGASVGGASNAAHHVGEGTQFNKELGDTALWTIDDGKVGKNPASRRAFNETVKAVVANPVIVYRAMFHDAITLPWDGRLLITLNDDPTSLEMMPDLYSGMSDKVIVLRFNDPSEQTEKIHFPPKHELERTIAAELPYMLRWLSDWEPPAGVMGENRFGVAAYVNSALREKAMYTGDTGDIIGIVEYWAKNVREWAKSDWDHGIPNGYGSEWIGTAPEFYAELFKSGDEIRSLITKFTPRQLGIKLSSAAEVPGSGVCVEKNAKGNRYRITIDAIREAEKKAEKEQNAKERREFNKGLKAWERDLDAKVKERRQSPGWMAEVEERAREVVADEIVREERYQRQAASKP